MINTKINGDFDIFLPAHRARRPEWYSENGWEKNRLRSIYNNIGDKDVVYYVGGEEGEMVALCQKWGAQTVIFEPSMVFWSNYPLLWKANNLNNPIACIPAFASNKNNNLARIYFNEFPPESEFIVEREIEHDFKFLQIDGDKYGEIKIDSCVYEHKIAAPTALILDVEGSEWEVLKGSRNTIAEYKPKIWLSGHPEFMMMYWQQNLSDLRKWIKDFGYEETLLDYEHEVHLFYRPIEGGQ